MLRYMWIILLIFTSGLGAYSSFRSNQGSVFWGWIMLITGSLSTGVWILVTKVSNDLIFDNLIFNFGICATYTIALAICGCAQNFSVLNWIGVVMTLVGLTILKI